MSTSSFSSCPARVAGHSAVRRRRSLPALVAAALAAWRQRRALAALDESRLDDLGLSPEDVAREIRRPVWDVPAGWRR